MQRVVQLQNRRREVEEARIQSLNLEQCQDLLMRCLQREPGFLFDILAEENQADVPRAPHLPHWCVCGRCREMPTDIENKCCRQEPQHCISQLPHMDAYIIEEGGLRLARRLWNDIRAREDPPDPGEDNKQYRFAAYRQYCAWQYGALGQLNRRVIPSCVVWRIRDKFPDPHHQYVGFIPRRL
uniref:P2X purinoreceptor 7 intracellular domain-containing protein n=1 Tax=Neogobius melanostomus TaxID=47308 RepID=A0A8C6SS73_9GOBI